jgi:hypothetical protein
MCGEGVGGRDRRDEVARLGAARYFNEVPGVDIDEAQLLVTALGGLRAEDPRAALLTLVALCHGRGELEQLERVFRDALRGRPASP